MHKVVKEDFWRKCKKRIVCGPKGILGTKDAKFSSSPLGMYIEECGLA